MDFTNTFKNEVFRPTVTLLIPGGIALAPYIILLNMYNLAVQKLINTHYSTFLGVCFLCSITAGLLLENIGARMEICFDRELCKNEGCTDHDENWKRYWQIAFTHEPVGHRYLRTMVLRLKFELSMIVALPLSMIGFLILFQEFYTCFASIGLVVGFIVMTACAYYDAKSSVKVLSDIRKEILKGVNIMGATKPLNEPKPGA